MGSPRDRLRKNLETVRALDPDGDGTEEFKVSILVHAAFLLFLTAWFAVRGASLLVVPQVHQVRLIGPNLQPVAGSGKVVRPSPGSTERSGEARQVSRGNEKGNGKPAGRGKHFQRRVTNPSRNPQKNREVGKRERASNLQPPVAEPREPVPVLTDGKPSSENRPYLHQPAFDAASPFLAGEAPSSTLSQPPAGDDMGEPAAPDLPALDDVSPIAKGSGNESLPPSGNPDSTAEPGGGEIQIEGIESLGGGLERFEAPKILSKVLPEYPEWARRKGISGQAVYRVLIQEAGTVGDVLTLSSTIDPKLAVLASQSLRRWVFTPVLVAGEPRETWVRITMQFQLN